MTVAQLVSITRIFTEHKLRGYTTLNLIRTVMHIPDLAVRCCLIQFGQHISRLLIGINSCARRQRVNV